VLSVSDIPPKFDRLGYAFNITENNPDVAVGSIAVTASKNLKDEKIIVSVINDESNLFIIDRKNLQLKV